MLSLSRKLGERVVMAVAGHLITVDVLEVSGSRVQLGFAADPEVKIFRDEMPAAQLLQATCRAPQTSAGGVANQPAQAAHLVRT